jgi:hypothetical protein
VKVTLTKYFWISFAFLVVLFFIPYVITYNAPFVDGSRVIGFPLTAYSYGGWCVVSQSCYGFIPRAFIVDVLIIIVTPLIVNYLTLKFRKS